MLNQVLKSNRDKPRASSPSEGPVLAIDFGTTRTKVAYHDEQRATPRLIELGREQRAIIPSVFFLPKDGEGEILVGDDAQDMVESDPEGIVVGLKMEIDRYGKIRRGLGRLTIERDRLASYMFGYIRRRCMEEVFHGQQIVSCSLTVPSGFGEPQRELLRRAAELGGFRAVTLVDEPVAAAQAWLTDSGQKMSDRVLVCDVGGGTTDFALVGITNGRVRVESDVSPGGISLGGNDVDRNVWEQAVELHGDLAQGLSVLGDGFRIKLRRIRERLGMERKKSYSATVGPETVKLSVEVFDKDITAFVENVAQETQRYAGKLKSQARREIPILLVGGGSQMPGLKQALEALKLGPVLVWNNSEFATVLGAVPTPAPKTSPAEDKAGRWEDYRKAVEVCWADKTIQPGEVDHLAKLTKQLGISGNEAEQIERVVTGKTVAELIASASEREAGPTLDRKAFRKKISDGNAAAAFAEASRVLEENPSDDTFELWYEAARVVEDAKVVLDRSREIQRKRDNDLWGTCCLALALCEMGRDEEAVAEMAHLIEPKKTPFSLLLAQWATKDDELEQKNRLEKRIMALGRFQAVLLALKVDDELTKGNLTVAADLIEQATAFNPGEFALLTARCWAFLGFQLGDEQAFKKDLAAVERMAPSHWEAQSIKATWLMRNADWASALSRWHRVLEDPRVLGNKEIEPDCRFIRAKCHEQCGDGRAALGDIEECLHLNPSHVAALIWHGNNLLGRGSVAEAQVDFDLAASLAPNDIEAILGQAQCRLRLGRPQEAGEAYFRACILSKNSPDAVFGLSLSCVFTHISPQHPPANIYVWDNIPEYKLKSAFNAYIAPHRIDPSPSPILLYDDTFLGGADDGLCLTEDRLFWHHSGHTHVYCREYSAIQSVVNKDGRLLIDGNTMVSPTGAKELVPVITALVQLHRKLAKH